MWYIAQGHCTNYRAVIETELHSEDCETFKLGLFATRIVPECWHALKRFQGRVGFMGLGSFNNFSSKTKQKSYTIMQLNFEWKIQPKDGHTQGLFFPKIRDFFLFSGKGRWQERSVLLPPKCVSVSVDEYGYPQISLNIPKYP